MHDGSGLDGEVLLASVATVGRSLAAGNSLAFAISATDTFRPAAVYEPVVSGVFVRELADGLDKRQALALSLARCLLAVRFPAFHRFPFALLFILLVHPAAGLGVKENGCPH